VAIAEGQLNTWSSLGPTTQFTDTYNSIRNNLLDKGAPYPLADTVVFLQGSYKNTSNVYGDSDVDIVLCHKGAFYKDLTRLSPADLAAYNSAFGGGVEYDHDAFKRDATAYVTRLYNSVQIKKKVLFVPGNNSGRRDADLLIASRFRRYHEYKSSTNQRYDEGICFFPTGGTMVENFPEQHSANCTTKHQNTNSRFKPMVRIFKNMRNTLIEKKLLANGIAPSYFIEGMLYNVPNDKFVDTYQQTWINCFNYIVTAKREDLVTANYMHWLVRDGTPTSWPIANFDAFTAALKKYWES
jgi:hypothetical protein